MSDTEKKSPSAAEFYLEYPLYESVSFDEEQERYGLLICFFSGTMDSYCPDCGSHSIFQAQNNKNKYDSTLFNSNTRLQNVFSCSRNYKHKLYFFIQVNGRTIQKIGQFPSLADLSLFDVGKYGKVLDNRYFHEFKKAIGLAAHGVGVGSFVYLRRIFESLIEQAHSELKTNSVWDEDTFQKARMNEKIQLLSDLLPEFLVKNKNMYGILSKGVHELTEKECLDAFPLVKVGIEIILDAKLEELERKKKIEEAQKALQKLGAEISQ